jgi:hypothetical protein
MFTALVRAACARQVLNGRRRSEPRKRPLRWKTIATIATLRLCGRCCRRRSWLIRPPSRPSGSPQRSAMAPVCRAPLSASGEARKIAPKFQERYSKGVQPTRAQRRQRWITQKSFHIWRATSRAALSPEYTYRSRSRWAARFIAAARISASVRGNVTPRPRGT